MESTESVRHTSPVYSELKFCATAQPSPSGDFVKQRESDSVVQETASSLSKPFSRKDWTSLDKAPHKAAEESSVVMARRSQRQAVCWVFLDIPASRDEHISFVKDGMCKD